MSMTNTTQASKASELSYQGPLIGMRSTRQKSAQETNAKTTANKQ